MNNLQDEIERLKKSPHYKQLVDYRPPLNPFEVIGDVHYEWPHSNVLAWLLSNEANIDFTKKFLDWVAKQDNVNDETKSKIENFPISTIDDIEVSREYTDKRPDERRRIDILARFGPPKLVIGIEVKVWASVTQDQLLDYQKLLENETKPDEKSVLILLTPASTDYELAGGVVHMLWRDITDIINKVNDASEKLVESYNFRKQFSQHIEKNILMDGEKRIVRKLLSEEENAVDIQKIISNQPSGNEATIQKIIDNMPPITDYLDKWKQIVAEVCGVEITSIKEYILRRHKVKHPGEGELKIHIKKWDKDKLPFTLMLYKYTNAAIRVLIWEDYLNPSEYEYREIYDKLELFKNHSNGIVEYRGLHWPTWRSVLASDNVESWEDPETTFNLYDKDWDKKAKEILRGQLLELKNADKENLLQLDNLK